MLITTFLLLLLSVASTEGFLQARNLAVISQATRKKLHTPTPQHSFLVKYGYGKNGNSHGMKYSHSRKLLSIPYPGSKTILISTIMVLFGATAVSNPMMAGILSPIALLGTLIVEIQSNNYSNTDKAAMMIELKDHQNEKADIIKAQLMPTLISWVVLAAVAYATKSSAAVAEFPSISQLVLAVTTFFSHQLADSCFDECARSKPTVTTALSVIVNLILAAKLSLSHIFFTFLFTKWVLQAVIAKTADNQVWIAMSAMWLIGVGGAAKVGLFPAIHHSIPAAFTIYLMLELVFGVVHELTQTTKPEAVKWVWRSKSVFHLLSIGLGLPIWWLMLESGFFLGYLLGQVVTDSVVRKALIGA